MGNFIELDFCFILTQLDDDIFFGVDNFVRVFPRREHFNQISGFLYTQSLPIRWAFSLGDENYKWICPHWMCPQDIYPPYTGGVGYVTRKLFYFLCIQFWNDVFLRYFFPGHMVNCLYQTSLETRHIYLEDVFVTGIVAQACGFQVSHQTYLMIFFLYHFILA